MVNRWQLEGIHRRSENTQPPTTLMANSSSLRANGIGWNAKSRAAIHDHPRPSRASVVSTAFLGSLKQGKPPEMRRQMTFAGAGRPVGRVTRHGHCRRREGGASRAVQQDGKRPHTGTHLPRKGEDGGGANGESVGWFDGGSRGEGAMTGGQSRHAFFPNRTDHRIEENRTDVDENPRLPAPDDSRKCVNPPWRPPLPGTVGGVAPTKGL